MSASLACTRCGREIGFRTRYRYTAKGILCQPCLNQLWKAKGYAGERDFVRRLRKLGYNAVRMPVSVHGDEPIIIRKNKLIDIIPIGNFVDSILSSKEKLDNVEALAFNSQYKIEWKNIKGVSRHYLDEVIYELVLETGRKVKVSQDHSIYVFSPNNNEVKSVMSRNLKIDSYVVIPRKLPSEPINLEKINLIDFLPANNYYVHVPLGVHKKLLSDMSSYERHKHTSKKGYRVPLAEIKNRSLNESFYSFPISYAGMRQNINPIIDVNDKFMRLLGYYVSEGSIPQKRSNRVTFSFGAHEKELIEDVVECLKSVFNLTPKVYKKASACDIEIDSKALSDFLLNGMQIGQGATHKRIPRIVFQSPLNLQKEFLMALFKGDGCKVKIHGSKNFGISYKTVSNSLANDLLYLLVQIGCVARVESLMPKERARYESYRVIVPNGELNHIGTPFDGVRQSERVATCVSNLIPIGEEFIRFYKETSLQPTQVNGNDFKRYKRIARENLDRVVLKASLNNKVSPLIAKFRLLNDSDFAFAKVRKINKVPFSGHVYDLIIDGQNFVGGFGGIILHNSGAGSEPIPDVVAVHPEKREALAFECKAVTARRWTVYAYKDKEKKKQGQLIKALKWLKQEYPDSLLKEDVVKKAGVAIKFLMGERRKAPWIVKFVEEPNDFSEVQDITVDITDESDMPGLTASTKSKRVRKIVRERKRKLKRRES